LVGSGQSDGSDSNRKGPTGNANKHKRAFYGVDRQECMPVEWAFMSGKERKGKQMDAIGCKWMQRT